MQFNEKNNLVTIKGKCETEPKYSHSVMGEGFYEFILAVPRLSDEVDYLPVTISERIIDKLGDFSQEIGIIGQLRSYNKMEEEKSKLILTIFVREIVSPDEINLSNQINITGYVCKQPIYRTTPFGREITDMLIAVNRSYNKSDYLPCIAWGRNARFTGDLNVGEKIELIGRIQSRKYSKKVNETETIIKTAYEISISSVILIDDRNIKNDNYNLTNKNVYSEYRNIENISIIQ